MLKTAVITTALALAAVPAGAETLRDQIVAELRSEGYSEIRMSRTLLGRIRFVAISEFGEREIVVNPSNGLVLRDYFDPWDDDEPNGSGSSGSGGSSGGSSGGGSGGGQGSGGSGGEGPGGDDDDGGDDGGDDDGGDDDGDDDDDGGDDDDDDDDDGGDDGDDDDDDDDD